MGILLLKTYGIGQVWCCISINSSGEPKAGGSWFQGQPGRVSKRQSNNSVCIPHMHISQSRGHLNNITNTLRLQLVIQDPG